MKHSQLILVAALALLATLLVACGGGKATTPDPTASPLPTAVAAAPGGVQVDATAAPAPTASPFGPGPQPGSACPVAVVLCEFAVQLQTAIKAGDADAFFALAHSVSATCTGEVQPGGPSAALCEGAAPNEVRAGFWDLRDGQGKIVSQAELRGALTSWFASISRAGGSDSYGPGELRIGSISCTRQPDQASGTCIGNSIQVHFTFINPPDAVDTGTPGERMTFHVSASVVDGQPRANGFGTVVPPNRVLTSSMIQIQGNQGTPLVVEVYPWTY
jgi:hypothetical protein